MGATSAKVRNRWNAKHYDRINITIPKGWAEVLKDFCKSQGKTMNACLTEVISAELEEFKKEEGK